jgi:hypothetical protein
MLEGLSQTLGLAGENRLMQARLLVEQISRDRAALDRRHTQADRQYEQARSQLRRALTARWPELGIPYHPDTEKILAAEAPAMQQYLESLRPWQTYQDLSKTLDDLDAQDTALEKKSIKAFRFIYQAESVILAHNLQQSATEKNKAVYADLLTRENRPLPAN